MKIPTSRTESAGRHAACLCVALLALAACSGTDASHLVVPPSSMSALQGGNEKLDVCHGGGINNVSTNAWPAHRGHGDYALRWSVDPATALAGDGIHFARISDAVSAADSTRRSRGEKFVGACRITIAVAPGVYVGSLTATSATLERLPIFIGVPDITLQGAQAMPLDGANRALGASGSGASILSSDSPLVGTVALVVVADDTSGYRGNGVTIERMRFRSGNDSAGTVTGGVGIGAIRVRDLTLNANHFEPALNSAVDMRGTRAVITRNYAKRMGMTCTLCLGGPGRFDVEGNRLIDGGFVGVFLSSVVRMDNFPMGTNPSTRIVETPIPPAVSAETAWVANNDIRDYQRQSTGLASGVRIVTFIAQAPFTEQQAKITLQSNTLLHNNYAVSVDANSPPTSPTVPSIITVGLSGNAVGPSCKNNLLVSFTRISRTLGVSATQSYLHDSSISLSLGGDTPWSAAWLDHPWGLGNTLTVDDVQKPNGVRTAPSDNPAGC